VLLEALAAVYWLSLSRLEGNLAFLAAVRTNGLIHFSFFHFASPEFLTPLKKQVAAPAAEFASAAGLTTL
jgi:hypothetical protein